MSYNAKTDWKMGDEPIQTDFNRIEQGIKECSEQINSLPKFLSGQGSPTSIPSKIGDEYMDLTNKKMYKAFGIVSISDWVILN